MIFSVIPSLEQIGLSPSILVPAGQKLLDFISDILSELVLKLFVEEHVEFCPRQYSVKIYLQEFAKGVPVFSVTNAFVQIIQGFQLMLVDRF